MSRGILIYDTNNIFAKYLGGGKSAPKVVPNEATNDDTKSLFVCLFVCLFVYGNPVQDRLHNL